MKHLSLTSLLLVALLFVFTGCDTAKEAAKDATAAAKDKVADLADIDFGDFDMKGMQEKLTGITDGFKDISADSVDGLTSKITDFSGALDGMGIDKLAGPAKAAVAGVIAKFVETIKSAMGGITDEGIMSKLKPVVDTLMEKVSAFQ